MKTQLLPSDPHLWRKGYSFKNAVSVCKGALCQGQKWMNPFKSLRVFDMSCCSSSRISLSETKDELKLFCWWCAVIMRWCRMFCVSYVTVKTLETGMLMLLLYALEILLALFVNCFKWRSCFEYFEKLFEYLWVIQKFVQTFSKRFNIKKNQNCCVFTGKM